MPGHPSSAPQGIAAKNSQHPFPSSFPKKRSLSRKKYDASGDPLAESAANGQSSLSLAALRVVIVAELRLVRGALSFVLEKRLGIRVVGEAADRAGALKEIAAHDPTVVLIEMRVDGVNALEVVEEARRMGTKAAFLIVSPQCDEVTAHRIEKARLHGFVDMRDESIEALRTALTEISQGRRYFARSFIQMRNSRVANPFSFDKMLTSRQHEVLTLLARLYPDDKIMKELKISPCTLRGHRRTIACKFNVPVKDLARYAREKGFGT